jgi:hypothetical protein|tara:strand:+ start:37874 stop:38602 length:729 start_codon:yes stop_codon:yes gene_type:complete
MAKMDKKILDELARFNNLSHNANNLNEVADVANLGMGSHIERLAKKFNIDMAEQEDVESGEEDLEIPLDPEAETDEVGDEVGDEVDVEELDLDDVELDVDDTGLGEPVDDTTELEVTDLVKKDEEISDSLEAQKDILAKNTEGLDDLMSKLNDLEQHLTSMDTMVDKISDLENKIETLRPKTPQEKMDLRKYDSGPFNNTLTDFFVDKQEVFDKTGKKEYVLTPEEVENYNEAEIKKSFEEE